MSIRCDRSMKEQLIASRKTARNLLQRVSRGFQCKKDQVSGIFSPKLNLYRAGNTTDLVFLPEPNCRFPHGGSLTATSLTDHRVTFPLTFDHSKWLILVHFLSLYLQWKCQLLLTKAIQSCWSDHFVQQDEVEQFWFYPGDL